MNENEDSVVKNKILFTVYSGTRGWLGKSVESDSIREEDLELWTKDAVLHHTGRAVSKPEMELFRKNRSLVRMNGDVKYTFSFDRYSIQ